jgi:crossover junction endodeoxyribonuclease RusA
VKLTLPYPPSLNNLYATVRGRRVLSAEGRRYKAEVAMLTRGIEVSTLPVRVVVRVYRPRRAGDLDNTLKCLLDSLTGAVWADDSQIVAIQAERFEDKSNPRVEIDIEWSAVA